MQPVRQLYKLRGVELGKAEPIRYAPPHASIASPDNPKFTALFTESMCGSVHYKSSGKSVVVSQYFYANNAMN